MAKETTQTGILGDLQRLRASTDANAAEIPHMEGTRLKLGALLDRATEINQQQAALTASRQPTSKEICRRRGRCTEAGRWSVSSPEIPATSPKIGCDPKIFALCQPKLLLHRPTAKILLRQYAPVG